MLLSLSTNEVKETIVPTETAMPVVTTSSTQTPARKQYHREVVDAILLEVDCSRSHAKQTIVWLRELVKQARQANYRTVYPTEEQLQDRAYGVFNALFPHGEAPRPGSAAAKLTALLLDRKSDEITIIHDMTDDSLKYCTVTVCTSAMRLAA